MPCYGNCNYPAVSDATFLLSKATAELIPIPVQAKRVAESAGSNNIASDMIITIDTSVTAAALRSPSGASAEILRRVLRGKIKAAASVPLFIEYEAVLLRPAHLKAAGVSAKAVKNLLDVLAGVVMPVEVSYLWRPQLKDADDEMVLEAAVNGQASVIVTFNVNDFLPAAKQFSIRVTTPAEFLKGAK